MSLVTFIILVGIVITLFIISMILDWFLYQRHDNKKKTEESQNDM